MRTDGTILRPVLKMLCEEESKRQMEEMNTNEDAATSEGLKHTFIHVSMESSLSVEKVVLRYILRARAWELR